MKKLITLLLVLLAAFFALAGCTAQSQENNDTKVYASIYPVYFLADRIAENGMEVELIMPPSADPHNWEPSAKEMAALEDCALFIYNGAGMEPWADKASELVTGHNGAALELASGFTGELITTPEEAEEGHEHTSEYDPHFWLDPVMAKEMAGEIKDALVELDPDNEELYNQNYSLLAKDLEKLDNEYKTVLARCQRKEFVVTHQAFGYLSRRYDLKQIAIMGISAESEPTPSRLAELTKTLEDYNISYVFAEPFTGSKVAQVLATETGARVLELNPIGGLSEEEMEAGTDYLSLMRDNLKQLKVALEYEE